MTIDVYEGYFAAECTCGEVERRAALVKLTSDSEAGQIRYTASVNFFPHTDETDFCISYDAYYEKELYKASGRRSRKREEKWISDLPVLIDDLAAAAGGRVFWDKPLREARRA